MRTIRVHLKNNFSEYLYYRYMLDKLSSDEKERVYETIRGLFTAKFDEMGYVCYRSFKVGLVLILVSMLLFIFGFLDVVAGQGKPIFLFILVYIIGIIGSYFLFKELVKIKKALRVYVNEGER